MSMSISSSLSDTKLTVIYLALSLTFVIGLPSMACLAAIYWAISRLPIVRELTRPVRLIEGWLLETINFIVDSLILSALVLRLTGIEDFLDKSLEVDSILSVAALCVKELARLRPESVMPTEEVTECFLEWLLRRRSISIICYWKACCTSSRRSLCFARKTILFESI